MADIEVVTSPPDLERRLIGYPGKLDAVMRKTMEASLLHIQSEIPAYPDAPPGVNTAGRTGTLGRTLGVSQDGGVLGKAQIHTVQSIGAASYEGKIGTTLWYSDRVIGNQEEPWSRYWWRLKGVAEKAREGVIKLHNVAAEELARFIDGIG